jgi:hypothetical protein
MPTLAFDPWQANLQTSGNGQADSRTGRLHLWRATGANLAAKGRLGKI